MRLVAGVVAVLALAAVAIVTLGGGGGGPAKLPIVMSGAGDAAGGREMAADTSAPAGDMSMRANIVYQAADGLPALEGKGRAYRIDSADVTQDDMRDLAAAFGLEGGITTEGSTWQLIDGDSQLFVFREGAVSWSYAATGAKAMERTAEASAREGCEGPDCSVSSDAATSDSAASGAASGVASDDVKAPDGRETPDTTVPVRPSDLPSQDDAEAIALDLFEEVGGDREHARVSSFDGITNWGVTIDPAIDGMPVIGFSTYVTVGAAGVVEWANGWLGTPAAGDEYPLVGTAAAIDRLNDPVGYSDTAGGAADSGATRDLGEDAATTTVADGEGEACIMIFPPPPGCEGGSGEGGGADGSSGSGDPAVDSAVPPADQGGEPPVTSPPIVAEPLVVTLTAAEQGLMMMYGADGREAFLVPAYLFESDQGDEAGPVVGFAISDEYVATGSDSNTDDGGSGEPGIDGGVKPEPMPMPEPAIDPVPPSTSVVG